MSTISLPKSFIDAVWGEPPIGAKNGVNLTFVSPDEFLPGTLQVYLSGLFLDKILDFTVMPDNKTFKIVLAPNSPTRLNVPPLQNEPLNISYMRA